MKKMNNYKVVIGLFYDKNETPKDIMVHGIVQDRYEWSVAIVNEILRLCKISECEGIKASDVCISTGQGEYDEKVLILKHATGIEHIYWLDIAKPEADQ